MVPTVFVMIDTTHFAIVFSCSSHLTCVSKKAVCYGMKRLVLVNTDKLVRWLDCYAGDNSIKPHNPRYIAAPVIGPPHQLFQTATSLSHEEPTQ